MDHIEYTNKQPLFVELRREPPRNDSSSKLVVVVVDGPDSGLYLGPGMWHVTLQNEQGTHIPGVTLKVVLEETDRGVCEEVWVVDTEGAERKLGDEELPSYRFEFHSQELTT